MSGPGYSGELLRPAKDAQPTLGFSHRARTRVMHRPLSTRDDSLTRLLVPLVAANAVEDFPMNGIPFAEVAAIVSAAGGRVAHAIEDDHAKPDWNGLRYFIAIDG